MAKPIHQPRGVRRASDDGADLVGDRAEGVARADDGAGCRAAGRSPGRRLRVATASCSMTTSSPVPGSGCARRPGRWCAAACSVPPAGRNCSGSSFHCATPLSLSLRSPKTIASAGQAAWQAVITSPSRDAALLASRPRSRPRGCAARSRCISPSRRASAPSRRGCASASGCRSRKSAYCKKLKRRTL